MNVLLLDTNVVSVLFNKNHSLRPLCVEAVAGRQLVISFMTLAELLLWPAANNWGAARRAALATHLGWYTTLYRDERTCAIWRIPLVTTNFRDYEAIDDLELVPIR